MLTIDLNCDLGEGCATDAEVMAFITSANIACGAHAGGPDLMRATVALALAHDVAIGAHPGWPDREGFGRKEMHLPETQVEALVLEQIAALDGIARQAGGALRHVKPHGALYNQAARDPALAGAIARAVRHFDARLILVGLAGSALVEAARGLGLPAAGEAFPDRGYQPDGSLRPRGLPGALRESPREIAAQAVELAREGIASGGRAVRPETLCLHGDHPNAAGNARAVRAALAQAGIQVRGLQAG